MDQSPQSQEARAILDAVRAQMRQFRATYYANEREFRRGSSSLHLVQRHLNELDRHIRRGALS